MTNTTDQYWEANGISLNTYANNLTSWGDGREGARAFRGENQLVPYRAGKRHVKKLPDSYVMTLSGWVLGNDGDSPTSSVEGFRANWRKLRRALWNRGEQFELTKRWIDADDGVTMRTATAMVEFVGGMEPKMIGPQGAFFSVDLELADPFFYGEEESIILEVGDANIPIEVFGDYNTTMITTHFSGPLTAAQLTVTDVTPQVWIKALTVPLDFDVNVDVDQWRAIETDGELETLVIGNIRYDGAPGLFILEPGEHLLAFDADDGNGTVELKWRPAWL